MLFRRSGLALLLCAGLLTTAAAPPPPAAEPTPTYADLADLSDSAPFILRAQIRRQAVVEPDRARGVRPGWVRLYIQAEVDALLFGKAAVGRDQAYLADVPLDARGKVPKLTKTAVLLFARQVPGRPGELQLVTPDAQIVSTPARDAQVRAIVYELVAPDAPSRIGTLREAINVAGDLAGESETQLFLTTAKGTPVAISVARRAGEAPRWNVSFSEVVENGAKPVVDSLAWYRLACFLPRRLPQGANLSESAAERAQAETDYAFVLSELGTCKRTRIFGLPG